MTLGNFLLFKSSLLVDLVFIVPAPQTNFEVILVSKTTLVVDRKTAPRRREGKEFL